MILFLLLFALDNEMNMTAATSVEVVLTADMAKSVYNRVTDSCVIVELLVDRLCIHVSHDISEMDYQSRG